MRSRCWHVIVPYHVRSTNKDKLSFHLGQSGSIFKMRAVWQKNSKHPVLRTQWLPLSLIWKETPHISIPRRKVFELIIAVDQQTLSAQIHLLLILLTLKHGEAVILMRKRHYRSPNETHTMLSFKMCSRGSFGFSGDQALMRNGRCLSIQLVQKVSAARSTSDPRTKRLNSGSPPPSQHQAHWSSRWGPNQNKRTGGFGF